MKNENFNQNVLFAILRTDFKAFARKVFAEVSGASEYQDNWHITCMCSRLTDMMDDDFNRILINVPPRSMKSIICSVALPAFILGKNPDANIICVSYADELAKKLAGDCRNVMESEWYQELFPNTRIDRNRRAVDNFCTTRGGCRFATSTNGTLTGIGAEWIIIDDPLKPQDAMSENNREKANEWYRGTLLSRLNDKKNGKILIVMQRLHENDLSGYVLNTDETYKLLKFPMIAEVDENIKISPKNSEHPVFIERHQGDLLHPERDSQEVVNKLRADLGEYAFAGQYQQNPAPLGGGLVKKEWMHWYPTPQDYGFSRIILSWDTASKVGIDNAYSACVTIGVKADKKMYILDCFRAKMEFPQLVAAAVEKYERAKSAYRCRHVEIIIEDKDSGTQLLQELRINKAITAVEIKPATSKEVRMSGITPQIENGDCLFPSFNPVWWIDFEHELMTFPASRFKDQCDALSQGIEYAKTQAALSEPTTAHACTMGTTKVFDPFDKNRRDNRGTPMRNPWGWR